MDRQDCFIVPPYIIYPEQTSKIFSLFTIQRTSKGTFTPPSEKIPQSRVDRRKILSRLPEFERHVPD